MPGAWQMPHGRWQMEDGRWQVEDGRWKMADGRWQMEDNHSLNLEKEMKFSNNLFQFQLLPIIPFPKITFHERIEPGTPVSLPIMTKLLEPIKGFQNSYKICGFNYVPPGYLPWLPPVGEEKERKDG